MKNWETLLRDLSMRLPYKIKCKITGIEKPLTLIQITEDGRNSLLTFEENHEVYLSEVKPILVSPKSLYKNKELRKELVDDLNEALMCDVNYLNTFDWSGSRKFQWSGQNELDFYLRNNIDIFGLIDKGLAEEKYD